MALRRFFGDEPLAATTPAAGPGRTPVPTISTTTSHSDARASCEEPWRTKHSGSIGDQGSDGFAALAINTLGGW